MKHAKSLMHEERWECHYPGVEFEAPGISAEKPASQPAQQPIFIVISEHQL